MGSHGAIKYVDKGSWFPSQKYGTCAYRSFHVWISSHLNPEQIEKLHRITTVYCIAQQRKAVNLLECAYKSKRTELLAKKLKESRILLKLGHQHFAQITVSEFLKK